MNPFLKEPVNAAAPAVFPPVLPQTRKPLESYMNPYKTQM